MLPRAKISLLSSIRIVVMFITFLMLAIHALDSEQSEPASSSPSSEEMTNGEVVRKAQAGDEASFNTLYHSYSTQIYRHLLRMVGNHEDASDLVTETFLKAWRGLSSLDNVLRFRSWLFSIATHTALDFLRQRRVSENSLDCLSEDPIDGNAAKFVGRLEERELVRLALQQVSPKPRACLLLQLEGFKLTEIAELVGLGKNSAGMYVSIAREQFRQAYKRLENL